LFENLWTEIILVLFFREQGKRSLSNDWLTNFNVRLARC
jgi:hypothetical protein